MIVCIDIGNTNIKLGFYKNGKRVYSFKMTTIINRTSDEYSAMLLQMLSTSNVSKDEVKGACMSCVIPQLEYTFSNVISICFGVTPLLVGVGVKTGLSIKYESPKSLGSDRIITCVAAMKKYGAPFILVDFGTATTFNVVSPKKEFLGGAITLGLKATGEAISLKTSKLPLVQLETPEKVVATTTQKAIQSGIIYGAVGQVKYIIERIKAETHIENLKVIATGGLSTIVESVEHVFDVVDRELSLDGLYTIYMMNKG